MLKVKEAAAAGAYRVRVKFENGIEKICDIEPFLEKGDFRELKDPSRFKTLRAIKYGIEWENGLDLSADTLEAIGSPVDKTIKQGEQHE